MYHNIRQRYMNTTNTFMGLQAPAHGSGLLGLSLGMYGGGVGWGVGWGRGAYRSNPAQ